MNYKYKTVGDFITEYNKFKKSAEHLVTGQTITNLDITEEMIWNAAREEIFCEQVMNVCCIDMLNCRGDESTCRHIKKSCDNCNHRTSINETSSMECDSCCEHVIVNHNWQPKENK